MKLNLVSALPTAKISQTNDEYLFYEPILAQRRKSQKVEVASKESYKHSVSTTTPGQGVPSQSKTSSTHSLKQCDEDRFHSNSNKVGEFS